MHFNRFGNKKGAITQKGSNRLIFVFWIPEIFFYIRKKEACYYYACTMDTLGIHIQNILGVGAPLPL